LIQAELPHQQYPRPMVDGPNARILRANHLASELITATELMSLGLNQVADPKWNARQPGGAFNNLAQGVERILKLTFWLAEQRSGRAVSATFGAGGAGHALFALHSDVMALLSADSAEASSYMNGLLSETTNDSFWVDALRALDGWAATTGRYRDLDALRGKEAHGDPPWAAWEEAEYRAVSEADGWGKDTDVIRAEGRKQMLLSIMSWWHTIYRSWQNGLAGEDGESFSSGLNPRNLHLDRQIADLVQGR